MWRFAPMADDYVLEWHSRDLDSTIIPREVAAVEEWRKTNLSFHVMRDNPVHGTSMLGGMFGILQNTDVRKISRRDDFNKMIRGHSSLWDKGYDQSALTLVVAPHAENDTLAHDSYLCQSTFISGSIIVPFPTQRLSGPNFTKPKSEVPNFVGNTGNYAIDKVCPVACRPKNHSDWKLC
jgi:hypothetical protein